VYVGQTDISPAEPSGQSGVVYAEKVQHVGMQVMYREPVFGSTVPEFVSGSKNGSCTEGPFSCVEPQSALLFTGGCTVARETTPNQQGADGLLEELNITHRRRRLLALCCRKTGEQNDQCGKRKMVRNCVATVVTSLRAGRTKSEIEGAVDLGEKQTLSEDGAPVQKQATSRTIVPEPYQGIDFVRVCAGTSTRFTRINVEGMPFPQMLDHPCWPYDRWPDEFGVGDSLRGFIQKYGPQRRRNRHIRSTLGKKTSIFEKAS
jgi:hypothetical protein